MAKTVKVLYNSDTLETVITVDGREFDTSRINGKEIEDWAYPFMIRKLRWNGFYDEIVEALGGDKEFNLVFEGSEDALAELKEAWEDAPVTIISDENGENTVLIEYDEDNLKTTITINGQAFDTSRIDGREIADWVYPFMIRKVKWNGIFEELSKAVGSEEYTIQFSGSNSAMMELMEECPDTISVIKNKDARSKKKINLKSYVSEIHNDSIEEYDECEEIRAEREFCEKYGYEWRNNGKHLTSEENAQNFYVRGLYYRDIRGKDKKAQRLFRLSYALDISLGNQTPRAEDDIDFSCEYDFANMFYYGSEFCSPNYEKALEFYEKMDDLSGADKVFIADCYEKIAEILFILDEYDSALEKYNDAIYNYGLYTDYCEENKNDPDADEDDIEFWQSLIYVYNTKVSIIYLSIAECYSELEDEKNQFKSLESAVLYDEENYLAQDWLGFCYLCGIGTSENPEKAAHCFYKSAEHDYPDAYYHLGLYYEKEIGDADKAQEIYEAGVELGSEKCEERLSEMVYNPYDDEYDDLENNHFFTKDNLKKGLKAGANALGVIGSVTGNPIVSGIAEGAKSLISSILDEDEL